MDYETQIGTKHADGTRVWPALDINGNPYTKPATTVTVAPGKFVVLPPGFKDMEQLERVRASVNPSVKAAPKSKVEDVDGRG